MLLNKTARSSTLRLALVYVALFSAAIFGLLAYVYWSTVSYLEHDLDRTARAESRLLMQAFDRDGRGGVLRMIDRRINDERLTGWNYELADASLRPLAGNLPGWPPDAPRGTGVDAGWSAFTTIDITPTAAESLPLRATARVLANGDHLLVGRRIAGLDGFAAQTAQALGIAAALFLCLAAAAGISTARRSVTRIETINATSREIIRAGFGRRIPLRGSGDEWDELAANLNSMLDRIEQLVETNRQVSDNIAHDLRTPLTRMRSRLERAAVQALDVPGYQLLVSDTIGDLDGVLRTFSSLLRISRIEASDRGLGFARLDLRALAAEVAELFDAAAEEAAVRLVLSGEEPTPVSGDRDLLFDAIANLVDNAINHGGSGEVHILVSGGADAPCLTIADHGPGIPNAEHQHVFKRFYRLEQSRNRPGNGLGLSLVAAVAGLHGIRIAMADNAPGLRIELHFSPATDAADASRAKSKAVPADAPHRPQLLPARQQ